MYKLAVFVPATHLEVVKSALFAAGAGKIGNYDSCCWQVRGEGQFRPIDGANPFLGEKGKLEKVDEFRLEMVLEHKFLKPVIQALKTSHPYETPAYEVYSLIDI